MSRKKAAAAHDAAAENETPLGWVRMKAPKRASSVSYDGEEYMVEGGHVVVPEAAYGDLVSHGYTIPDEDLPPAEVDDE